MVYGYGCGLQARVSSKRSATWQDTSEKEASVETSRDLRAELEEYTAEHPTSWRPKPGSILVGTILRYDRGESAYGLRWIAVLKEEETGDPVSVWLNHKVLLEEFRRKRPKPGERIGIRRLEDAEKGYARYAVRVDRDEPEVPNFDELSSPGDVPPQEPENDGKPPF